LHAHVVDDLGEQFDWEEHFCGRGGEDADGSENLHCDGGDATARGR
jgi:hypothetical protein